MAIVDAQCLLSDGQTLISSGHLGSVSENTYDLGGTNRDIGTGKPLFIVLSLKTAMVGASEIITVGLLNDDAANIGSATTVRNIAVFPAASAIGTTIVCPVYPETLPLQYLGLSYTGSGGTELSAGSINAWITTEYDVRTAYPNAARSTPDFTPD